MSARPPIDALRRLLRDVAISGPLNTQVLTYQTPANKWKNLAGAGGGGSGATTTVTQTAHGFIIGNVLRYNGTIYVKAQADTAQNAEVIGIVKTVIDVNTFELLVIGAIAGLSGLSAGTTYFLSPTTAGAMTATEPTTIGQVSKPILVADTTTSGYFFNWRGMIIPSGAGTMTATELYIGTDLRLVSIVGGGKLQARNPGPGTWADVDQWTNP